MFEFYLIERQEKVESTPKAPVGMSGRRDAGSAPYSIDSLDEFIMNLNSFKNLLQNDKFGELKTQMTQINYIKNILKGIK